MSLQQQYTWNRDEYEREMPTNLQFLHFDRPEKAIKLANK